MKPVIRFFQYLLSAPANRKRSLAVWGGTFFFILGFSVNSLAADAPPLPCSVPGSCDVSVTVTKDNRLADGNHYDIVEVIVTDHLTHKPVSGVSLSFTLEGTTGNTPGTTDANGIIDFPVSRSTPGLFHVTISMNGTPVTALPVVMNFVPNAGPPDPNNPNNALIVDITDQAADGTSMDVIHAHLVDANDNEVTGTVVTFQAIGGNALINAHFPPTAATVNGDAAITITDVKEGTVIFTATFVDPITGITHTISPIAGVTVRFVSAPPVTSAPGAPTGPPSSGNPTGTTGTLLSIQLNDATADGSAVDSVRAHITDANGNAVANAVVTFTIVGGGDPGTTANAKFSNGTQTITGTTDADGNVCLITITDNTAGTVYLDASISPGGAINGSSAKLKFVAGPAVPTAPGAPTGPTTPDNPTGTTGTLLTIKLNDAIADDVNVDGVKAHITDANGNPVANQVVTFTIVTGGDPGTTANAKFSNGTQTITGTTDANGNVSLITITDKTAGTAWISASIDPGGAINGSPAKLKFVAGPPVPSAPDAPTNPGGGNGNGGGSGGNGGVDPQNPTGSTGTFLTIWRDSVSADGVQRDSVKAHITDKYGNNVGANVAVVFTITAGGTLAPGVAQLVGNVQTITLMTDANGDIDAAIISPEAGTVSINAYIYNTSIIDGSARTVTFLNKPDVTNPETKLIVIVYQAMADGTSTTVVKAHVVDQHGVPLPSQDVTFAIDSGNATIITPQPVTTDLNGECSIQITSKKAGFALVTATVGGQSITFGSPAKVKFVPINIYVPPVFTPNGDGNNDVLKPILVGISTFHYFSVYNRWGNLIFTTEDANSGWDGRFKGVAQPVETYLWIAEGIDVQGNKVVQKGMTTLVR